MTSYSASTSAHPLSALSVSASSPRRSSTRTTGDASTGSPTTAPQAGVVTVAKHVVDPAAPVESFWQLEGQATSSTTGLSRLFTTNEMASPSVSRRASGTQYTRGNYPLHIKSPIKLALMGATASFGSTSLPSHIYAEGLLNGKHSDITIHAFGVVYPLHRLVICRVPFFAAVLSEPWSGSSIKDLPLHPEATDSNITKDAFELALKCIYGHHETILRLDDALSLFATGCWLEMADLVESSAKIILGQMHLDTVASIIHFFHGSYYGHAGDLLQESAKAVLCRDGHQMAIEAWDDIPSEIIFNIMAGDAFFVSEEWWRYRLARHLLNRRLEFSAQESDLLDADGNPRKVDALSTEVLCHILENPDNAASIQDHNGSLKTYAMLYNSTEIKPLVRLVHSGIHYMHLSFERLQKVKRTKDIFGLPIVPEKVISNALWCSLELRQKIQRLDVGDTDVGLTRKGKECSPGSSSDGAFDTLRVSTSDMVYTMGATYEAVVETYRGGPPRSSISIDNGVTSPVEGNGIASADVSPAAGNGQDTSNSKDCEALSPSEAPKGSVYPPYRCSFEFITPRKGKRTSSDLFWYAGSTWCLYIQATQGSKQVELGVYLHRIIPTNRLRLTTMPADQPEDQRPSEGDVSTSSPQDQISVFPADPVLGAGGSSDHPPRSTSLSELVRRQSKRVIKSSNIILGPGVYFDRKRPGVTFPMNLPEIDDDLDAQRVQGASKVATLPPYADSRFAAKTYFRIYTPSKTGRVVSVYESAPLLMNGRQSWGWKSGSLVIDDIIAGQDDDKNIKDGKLKFMVVLGEDFGPYSDGTMANACRNCLIEMVDASRMNE